MYDIKYFENITNIDYFFFYFKNLMKIELNNFIDLNKGLQVKVFKNENCIEINNINSEFILEKNINDETKNKINIICEHYKNNTKCKYFIEYKKQKIYNYFNLINVLLIHKLRGFKCYKHHICDFGNDKNEEDTNIYEIEDLSYADFLYKKINLHKSIQKNLKLNIYNLITLIYYVKNEECYIDLENELLTKIKNAYKKIYFILSFNQIFKILKFFKKKKRTFIIIKQNTKKKLINYYTIENNKKILKFYNNTNNIKTLILTFLITSIDLISPHERNAFGDAEFYNTAFASYTYKNEYKGLIFINNNEIINYVLAIDNDIFIPDLYNTENNIYLNYDTYVEDRESRYEHYDDCLCKFCIKYNPNNLNYNPLYVKKLKKKNFF